MARAQSDLSWDDFRLVQAIADSRSLVGAAHQLGLNHSTVFRRLGAIEEALGQQLFERLRTGYAATRAGEEMAALARRMALDVVNFERRIVGRDVKPTGELRITTNDTLLAHLLTPIFAGFIKAFPSITLDVIIGNQALNLSKRDADIAIRASTEVPETLVGRRIAQFGWSCYAPHALFAEKKGAIDMGDSDLRWVGYSDSFSGFAAKQWLEDHVPAERIVFRLNTLLGLAQAIEAGIGCGLLPCFIGDNTPGIERARIELPPVGASLWLLTHPDLRQSARVRAFMDFAGAELTKKKRFISGE